MTGNNEPTLLQSLPTLERPKNDACMQKQREGKQRENREVASSISSPKKITVIFLPFKKLDRPQEFGEIKLFFECFHFPGFMGL